MTAASDDGDRAVADHTQDAEVAVFSNKFRCRHLQAVSLRRLLMPHDEHGDTKTKQPEAGLISPGLGQLASDESAPSSGSEGPDVDDESALTTNGLTSSPDHERATKLPAKVGKRFESLISASEKPKKRPSAKRQVSRSMSVAFAEARQQLLEERIHARRLDSFFSLHGLVESGDVEDVPVYVSEIQQKFMNPDFRTLMPDEITNQYFLRGRTLAVRVWAKTPEDERFLLLIEERIAIPELYFVAEDMDYSTASLHENTVLLHFPDGVYTSYASSEFETRSGRATPKAPQSKSASFDTLMKLKKLVEVIDDATATQQVIKQQIELIVSNSSDRQVMSQSSSAKFALQNIHDASARLDRDIGRLKHNKELRNKAHTARKQAFEQARERLKERESELPSIENQIAVTQRARRDLKVMLRSHTARVAEDILYIFPIEPLPAVSSSGTSTPESSRPSSAASSQRRSFNPGLAFSIRNLHIPHANILGQTHPPRNEPEVSAALGFVGGVVMFLSRVLLLHVPFPVHVLGSGSVIRDDITADHDLISNRLLLPSQMNSRTNEIANASSDNHGERTGWNTDSARTFPLYARNADPARFRWAVYLLNRDVEELVSKNGLRVVDVRDTLANLRLLLVALAGGDKDSNLPKREAGRVAGLRIQ